MVIIVVPSVFEAVVIYHFVCRLEILAPQQIDARHQQSTQVRVVWVTKIRCGNVSCGVVHDAEERDRVGFVVGVGGGLEKEGKGDEEECGRA
jgi:hypothetical protein